MGMFGALRSVAQHQLLWEKVTETAEGILVFHYAVKEKMGPLVECSFGIPLNSGVAYEKIKLYMSRFNPRPQAGQF